MYVVDIVSEEKITVEIEEIIGRESLRYNKSQFTFDWPLECANKIVKLQIKRTSQIEGLMSMDVIHEELRIEIRFLELSKENIGKEKK